MEKRTRSVGTKLTEAEYERLERAAEARGLKLGEWAREALRTIVLNVMYELAAGEEIDAERMRSLI